MGKTTQRHNRPQASPTRGKRRRDMTERAREKRNWGDAVDPDGDCKFELEPREDKVRIIVPGKTHILSAEIGRVNAPRILRDIKGDFDVSVRVAGTSHPGGKATTTVYPPYHGAGLLIWQDQENYVRLEIAADHPARQGCALTSTSSTARTAPWPLQAASNNADGSNHLRLKRRGDEIFASFGPDGVRWTSFLSSDRPAQRPPEVGVTAINSSTKPLTAEFERFDVVERSAN